MRIVLAAVLTLWAAAAPASECVGTNLFEIMTPDQRAQIDAAVSGVPYHRGLLWRASKGDQSMTLVGTYHFGDPRHDAMLARLEPMIADAATVLVEAGPEEERKLTEALAADPALMVDATGPTLPERLDDKDWRRLSDAMAKRGTPAVVTSKLRPWYVAMMLGISPCMMEQMAESGPQGLDHRLVDRAEALDVPVRALEPWDTVFTLFRDLTPQQEIEMVRAALPTASYADDYAVTLTDAYFAGDIWAIWEFGRFDAYRNSGLTREQIDAQMDLAQRQLMDGRNRAWIGPLTQAAGDAARQGKGIVAGFGALHLPGEGGVLRLLEKDGWTIERLDG
ncbi:TraB/GumN family protein [Paracoccus benzoatiresistens]|uniref:TraB/GumN family protein n=1 Tax=Paracoccus benzoatiresistens TaxID=2997341 RepID=A0ABT4J850_9RHOB|nr:TraB/GumN family protein [Paracoccus sp. EF6]MCZ0963306.1 TraB/GumN family protein [Paracoccus sp. EF6]